MCSLICEIVLNFDFKIAFGEVEFTFSYSVEFKGDIMDLLENFQWGLWSGYWFGHLLK